MTRVVGRELGGDRAGRAVRQREEDDVVAGERLGRGLLQREVRERAQVRLHGDERLPGVRCAVTVRTSNSGWSASRRRISPPA